MGSGISVPKPRAGIAPDPLLRAIFVSRRLSFSTIVAPLRSYAGELRPRDRRRPSLNVDYQVFPGARAANQQVSGRRRIERLGIILHRSGNQTALTGMANSGPARPAHRDVAGFRKLQQALELGIPVGREAGASK